ncbi:hypothetical protein J1G42_00555 [Cellulomonas sp. zg-ZUI222]|uniref:Uncharacterized protein n=1 Tax=Cellulomonas wangleii TaxID=2816956 RepID=A0ABX8D525_9CELL|nr:MULTISPECIES: hypothetical protein [Cellulomonas]MBO0898452.1 hypothetical protein [Cellulomonas sp. zg-ZUI22]MBO0919316.1 hypothetical protein [Cellulomonas wangleii]MBO0924538.1 hypothetical protein [Cellulomonas wangleii]QVI62524.1 hypothetical protein KG103_00760 [Cellulomonas wangleii]
MTGPSAVLAALDGSHVLAVPRGTDLLPLARAWFPSALWAREPVSAAQAAAARPMTGARFRGIAVAPVRTAGALSLDGSVEVVGPYPVDAAEARALTLPPQDSDLYALPASPVPGATLPPDLVTGWATAVARRTAGGILPAARDRTVVPDPASAVDLTLWSAVPLSTADVLPLVRPALAGSRLTPPAPGGAGEGFALTATYEYDGTLQLGCSRSRDVPVVLSTLDWREHGPWAYRVTWQPHDPHELDQAHPSPLHVIARQRVTPSIARVVATLWRAAGGTVVDAGGFVVPHEELDARARAR